ncbi:hypothetical protein MKW92_034113, partial [Papaver armeniacum]
KDIDPSEPKDQELQARWSRLMLEQDRATTEEETLSVKRQKEELNATADARLRELRSKAVFSPRPRRRLTLAEVKKRSAWASKKAEKWITGFQEYSNEKEDGQ